MSLQGKVVLVTGASRGIGRALAVGLAKEGSVVVASARTAQPGVGTAPGSLEETIRQISDAGGSAVAIPCDVAQEEQVEALVKRTLEEVGPIDVLINNAGVFITGQVTHFSAADFDGVMAVNLRGPFLLCKQVLPGMMERRLGNIINISSSSAISNEPDSPVYGPSKAALDRLTLSLASDMSPYNIAVNGLRPGLIASEMTTEWEDRFGRTPEPPEVVVPAVLWLAQQDASTFTGNTVRRGEFGETWP